MAFQRLKAGLLHGIYRLGIGKKRDLMCDPVALHLSARFGAYPLGAFQAHNWAVTSAFEHRFDRLIDPSLQTDESAQQRAALSVLEWIASCGRWSSDLWSAEILSARVIAWVGALPWIEKCVNVDQRAEVYESLSQQITSLRVMSAQDGDAFTQHEYALARLSVALSFADYADDRADSSLKFATLVDAQILADGGHVSRSPFILLRVLNDCLIVRHMLDACHLEMPSILMGAIDRMAPMLRSLRHGDGTLAGFQGSYCHNAAFIDALLAQSGNTGHPFDDARHSRYQRIEALKTIMIMDVGAPVPPSVHRSAHAAPLSFEISYDEDCLLVNCGAVLGHNRQWQQALAATAAHCTLSVDDKNSVTLDDEGVTCPDGFAVDYHRASENGDVLLEATHNGYQQTAKLLHHRSVYMNKMGEDIRIEDRLHGAGGDAFAIHLHLHPSVEVSVVQDGAAALLKTASGIGWHLRVQGARIEQSESLYVAEQGKPKRTEKITLCGPLRGEGANVKWRLAKLGGL